MSKSPKNWEKVYKSIVEMRKERNAPVDVMGCERLSDNPDPKLRRFHCLVSLMLSSQTKDEVTAGAMTRLTDLGLTPENMRKQTKAKLMEVIKPVGFHSKKSEYLLRISHILLEKYEGDIPNTVKDLCSLPGIGPKMAYICMHVAWEKNLGIGVDVHVHRISERLGWSKKSKNPEIIRRQLESWLPKDKWNETNKLLVGFGQQICKAKNPLCDRCAVKEDCIDYQKRNKNVVQSLEDCCD
ncbi:hypothetical protein SNEBB_006745 [Seison nebaliae]|nr:hypothetical protein SNEBB_006745 [Seison nebaliae]